VTADTTITRLEAFWTALRVIIASDASADPEGRFEDLLKVLRRNAIDKGIVVRLFTWRDGSGSEGPHGRPRHKLTRRHASSLKSSIPGQGLTRAHQVEQGFLIYLKPSLTGRGRRGAAAILKSGSEFPTIHLQPVLR